MNEALKGLLGCKVRVYDVRGTYTDDGRLEAYDHPWLRVIKDGGEILCFPVYNVRLVKLIED